MRRERRREEKRWWSETAVMPPGVEEKVEGCSADLLKLGVLQRKSTVVKSMSALKSGEA